MTTTGWIMLAVSCGTITGMLIWCFARVLRLPAPSEELHTPLDIETDERP